ncbi:MAG: pilus assembly protein PilM [Candidatus Omnitrophota bacterium]
MQLPNNKDIIGIDLSEDKLMISQLKNSGGKKEFIKLLYYSTEGMKEEDISGLVTKAIKELKIKNPFILSIIPLHLTITKNLEIPSLDAKEIKEIVDLQSGRQTAYSREEIIVDYINIGVYRQSYTKILLVIVARDAVKKQFDIIEKSGLKVQDMVFAPEGITQLCLEHLNKELHNVPVGIVHVDANFTDFIISLRGMPIFTRSIPIGVKHFTDNKTKAGIKFVDEIKSSIETYQSEDIDAAPQSITVIGAIDHVRELKAMLSATVQVTIANIVYFDCLPMHHNCKPVEALVQNISFLNITSVFLTPKSLKVSLIPEEVKLKRVFEERTRQLVKLTVNFMIIMLLVGSFFISKTYFEGAYFKRLTEYNETIKAEAKILEKNMERIRIIKHYLKNRGYALQVIAALYDIIPENIMLTSIKMDTQRILNLKGTGRAMSNVFSFVSALEASDYFANVQTNYTTSRKQGGKDWADFGISCVLETGLEIDK